MENQELKFPNQLLNVIPVKSIYRREEAKRRELERVGGIFMTYPRTGVCFRLGTEATRIFGACVGFSGCCHGNCQLLCNCWVCHLANVLQKA